MVEHELCHGKIAEGVGPEKLERLLTIGGFVTLAFVPGLAAQHHPAKQQPPSPVLVHLIQERDGFFGRLIEIQITKKVTG